MDEIYTRRSIRSYSDKPISRETLDALVKAGMNAPSAGNARSARFITVEDRAVLDAIPELHKYATMLHQAPAAIVVCGDVSTEYHQAYWVQDCAAATQNILLEATSRGIGSCWLGIHPREEREKGLSELLGLPSDVRPLSVVALGYPAEDKEPNDFFEAEWVHRDRW